MDVADADSEARGTLGDTVGEDVKDKDSSLDPLLVNEREMVTVELTLRDKVDEFENEALPL